MRERSGMVLMDEEALGNPFWQALRTEHASLAVGEGLARRYPTEVLPFAGLAEPSVAAVTALRELLGVGEAVYVVGDELPAVSGMDAAWSMPGLQMILPEGAAPASVAASAEVTPEAPVETMRAEDAEAMVALTEVAFPGYFRRGTPVLGSFYGIREGGLLVAMAGERLALPGWREISTVCTHPAHRGKGYAGRLIRRVLREHAHAGLRSFLQVAAGNDRALTLYRGLGFVPGRKVMFRRLERVAG